MRWSYQSLTLSPLTRDLQDLSQKKVRSADIDSEKSILCYLKSDVEKR